MHGEVAAELSLEKDKLLSNVATMLYRMTDRVGASLARRSRKHVWISGDYVSMSPDSATIIGNPISPYVRKVLAVCEMKGIPYRLDPIVPFFGDDKFSELNPLRRIPVFIDDEVSISDSTVICEYLEERYPSPALLPSTPAERARARWIEEFADTRVGDVLIWRIFYEAVLNPYIWQKPRDKEKIARIVAEDLPQVMADLERLAPADGLLFGALSVADISVALPFRDLTWARVELDTARW